ncbi:MAG: cyclic pyranopterin monophosphate synthase MoaC [Candidatus Bathyarchaeia archaeon]
MSSKGGEIISKAVSMVDITPKPEILRTAEAEGIIRLKPNTIKAIKEGKISKGNIFAVAELSAINAVKKTPENVLLAHPIPITGVDVKLEVDDKLCQVKARVKVTAVAKTGVELEALAGVMASLLNIFDMCKYLEKKEDGQYDIACITDIRVLSKRKGS